MDINDVDDACDELSLRFETRIPLVISEPDELVEHIRGEILYRQRPIGRFECYRIPTGDPFFQLFEVCDAHSEELANYYETLFRPLEETHGPCFGFLVLHKLRLAQSWRHRGIGSVVANRIVSMLSDPPCHVLALLPHPLDCENLRPVEIRSAKRALQRHWVKELGVRRFGRTDYFWKFL